MEQDDIEIIKVLNGYSGCKVELCRRNNDAYFVRKTSASQHYNPRFALQMQKQARLSPLIRTPRVLAHGEAGGLFFADMEYVSGSDFPSHAASIDVTQVRDAALGIVEPIRHLLAVTQAGSIDPDKFRIKLDAVGRSVRASPYYELKKRPLDAALAFLQRVDWSGIPQSECHGDLTLENVLVGSFDGKPVFIDLLDGELESVWLDLAKLLQDLASGWSFRSFLWKPERSTADQNVSIVSHHLYEETDAQVRLLFPDAVPRLPQLRALQACRVLPYVRDPLTFAHVAEAVERILPQWRP